MCYISPMDAKIKITPSRSDIKPSDCYVYINHRMSNNEPFYVGKGSGIRGWLSSRVRGDWWNRVAIKHGVYITIAQDGLSEDDALLLEMWLIAKFRHSGISLVNMTNGGDGVSGFSANPKKTVYCSNGMSFSGLSGAKEWLRENGNETASVGAISVCARGKSNSAHGFSWSYDGFPKPPEFSGIDAIAESTKKTHSRKIYCSNGMEFKSGSDAAAWISNLIGRRVGASAILNSCDTEGRTSHGFAWSRVCIPDQPKLSGREAISAAISASNSRRSRGVSCSNGMKFCKVTDAVEWLKSIGNERASANNICTSASKENRNAYGFKWSYTN